MPLRTSYGFAILLMSYKPPRVARHKPPPVPASFLRRRLRMRFPGIVPTMQESRTTPPRTQQGPEVGAVWMSKGALALHAIGHSLCFPQELPASLYGANSYI
jgi:hypothetical protein